MNNEIMRPELVDLLIDSYSDLINEYRFDQVLFELTKRCFSDKDYNNKLKSYMEDFTNLIDEADVAYTAFRYLMQAIVDIEGFNSVLDGIMTSNYKDRYTKVLFPHVGIGKCDELKYYTIPPGLLKGCHFNCDLIINVNVLYKEALKGIYFDNHNLFIEEGCKEIGLQALGGLVCRAIYLPSTLKTLNYNAFDTKDIIYNGTVQQFTTLMEESNWKESAARLGSPYEGVNINCLDGIINLSQALARVNGIVY